MTNILLIENRPDFEKTLKLKLLTHLKVTAVVKSDINEATDILDLIPNITLIAGLLDASDDHNVVQMLKVYCDAKFRDVSAVTYTREDSMGDIVAKIAHELKIEYDESKLADRDAEFHPISLSILKGFEPPCDIYLKVGSGTSANYVKRVHAFETIDDNLFEKLLSFEVENVFIHKDDFDLFFTALSNQVATTLNDDVSPDEKIERQFSAFQYVYQYAEKLDFNKYYVQIVDHTVESVVNMVYEHKPLSDLINKVVLKKDSVQFQSFYLTNLMGAFLLSHTNLANKTNLKYFTYAALFCDLGLENRHTFFINSQLELDEAYKKKTITKEEYQKVKVHAHTNAKSLSEFPGMPQTVIRLIQESHGSAEGVSFDDDCKELGELSKVFMVANTFIKYFLNPVYRFNKKSIIERMLLRYNSDDIRKLCSRLSLKIA